MKDRADLVRGLLRKAASDRLSMEATRKAGAYDGACFHAQQAAEKYLKAFLTYHAVSFPYTHNLAELTELCAGIDEEFQILKPRAAPLTTYAVRLRYDDLLWPSREDTDEECSLVSEVERMVLRRLPEEITGTIN